MSEPLMLVLGYTAQALFGGRFALQWVVSERSGRSVVPAAFWLFSVAGGILMLLYAVLRKDQVFILGQALGLAIYVRNLTLLRREKTLRDPGRLGP
ncbi:MAG TPA: lipid-A-disaccharide synthase N-terminal domain-containing protein [Candidatus Polarisedimenticolia bacterium]|jgi:lipid-A-disaccharide synthase-like uncharacterized protein|nr:lipid-A-disaccharide synthase N-terminal domain-containing protein [Candidatus Polarisedimenticolia bacterium]